MEQLNTITRDELKEKIERGDDFLLVEVTDGDSYRKVHLPGAVRATSAGELEKAIPDHDHEVVLYAENLRDRTSLHLTRELVGKGFRRIYEYEDGKEDWIANDLPVEDGRA